MSSLLPPSPSPSPRASALSQIFCCTRSLYKKPRNKLSYECERREVTVADPLSTGKTEALGGGDLDEDTSDISSSKERCFTSSSSSSLTIMLQTRAEARPEEEEGPGGSVDGGGTDEQRGRGRRAVNVVAQLMGLDNLPPFSLHRFAAPAAAPTESSLCKDPALVSNINSEKTANTNPAISKSSGRIRGDVLSRNLSLSKRSGSTADAVLCRNTGDVVHTGIITERTAGRNPAIIAQNAKRTADAVLCRDPVVVILERAADSDLCRNPGIISQNAKRTTDSVHPGDVDVSVIRKRATDAVLYRGPAFSKVSQSTTVATIDENGAPWLRNQNNRAAAFSPLRAHNDTVTIVPPIESTLFVKAAPYGFIEDAGRILETKERSGKPCIGKPRIPVDSTKVPRRQNTNSLTDMKPAAYCWKDHPRLKAHLVNVMARPRSDPDVVKLKTPENPLHKSPVKSTSLPSEDRRKVEGRIKNALCKKQSMISISNKKAEKMMQLRNPELGKVSHWRFDDDRQSDQSSFPHSSGGMLPTVEYNTKHCVRSSVGDVKGASTIESPDNAAETGQESSNMSLLVTADASRKQTSRKIKESKGLRHGLNIQRPNKKAFVEGLPDLKKVDGRRFTKSHPNSIFINDRGLKKNSDAAYLDRSFMHKHNSGRIVPGRKIMQNDKLLNREVRERWIPCVFEEGVNRTYDLRISQDAPEFSCESSNADLSSCEDPCTPEKKPVELNSGKSTMMVLQELLLALKPSEGRPRQGADLKKYGSNTSELTDLKSSLESDGCRGITKNIKKSIDHVRGNASAALSFNFLQDMAKKYVPEKCSEDGSRISNVVHNIFEDSSTCLGSFTFTEGIDDNGCESFKYTSIIATESCRNNVQVALNEGARIIISSEQDYVKCILSSLMMSPSDVHSSRMQFSHTAVDPSLFDKLEELVEDKWDLDSGITVSQKNHSPEVAKLNRKLIFDCVLEVLGFYSRNDEELQLSCALSFQDSLSVVARNVMKQVEAWKCMNCWLDVDEMLQKAMNTTFGRWSDPSCEDLATVIGIMDAMINDLIQELILELGFHS